MITLGMVYLLTGAYLALIAWQSLRDSGNPRRYTTAAFWGLLSLAMLVGERLVLVLAYALGMAMLTMSMGKAFAVFPVITAGIGLPLLVQGHGADAASLAAIGMLSGYCGTLMTPMAANFNLVPAALLELKDPNAVIRAQIGTAIPLLECNVVLMSFIVFRGV